MPKKSLLCALLVLGFLFAFQAAAEGKDASPIPLSPATTERVPGGRDVMNGYSMKQFPGFPDKWQLVTVRYRKDTGEMRFTYANDIAWKALLAGVTDYPDGAVFGKVGVMTEEDPAFTSSAVPLGAMRYQLMVRDKKKHADTHGWGYALFDSSGLTFDHDPINQGPVTAQACNACHEIVPERGYVFSRPVALGKTKGLSKLETVDTEIPRIMFSTEDVAKLPAAVSTILPKTFQKIELVDGAMREHMFQGTIDEIRPTLTKEAQRSKLPVALVNKEGTRFSLVYIDPEAPDCKMSNGKKGVQMQSHYTTNPGGQEKNYPVASRGFCEALRR